MSLTASKGRVGLHGTNFCKKKTTNKAIYGGRLESTQRREKKGEERERDIGFLLGILDFRF